MFRRPAIRRLILVAVVVAIAVAAWLWIARPFDGPRVQAIELDDGTPVTLVTPANETMARVLVITPHDMRLSHDELIGFARRKARVIQLELPEGRDCMAAARLVDHAIDALKGAPDLVAGVEEGGEMAYRWLARQTDPKAHALAVELDITHPACDIPLPEQATHGRLSLRWNDSPEDSTALFVRNQPNTDTTIADYTARPPAMLVAGVHAALAGNAPQVPVVEVHADTPEQRDTVTLFYSGDGGWRDLDKVIAGHMTENGYPVVGVDVLRYFWDHKSPETLAADLSRLMQTYREKWGARRFVLAGYSFGADVLPATYNRLPQADRNQVDAMLLLALARSGNFEIQVSGWLGHTGTEAQVIPELRRVPAEKIFCVYGDEEIKESGCTAADAPGEKLMLKGGHHFDGDYTALAKRLMQAIDQRQR